MEAAVGAEGITFAPEHARRILVLALEGKYARGKREGAGQVLAQAPLEDLAMVLEARQRHLRYLGSGEGYRV